MRAPRSVTFRGTERDPPKPPRLPGGSTEQEWEVGVLCSASCPPGSGRACAAPGSLHGRRFCRRRCRRRAGSHCGSGGRAPRAHVGWRTPAGGAEHEAPGVQRGRGPGSHLCTQLSHRWVYRKRNTGLPTHTAAMCCVSWEGPFPSLRLAFLSIEWSLGGGIWKAPPGPIWRLNGG